jgi:hypothetical protein
MHRNENRASSKPFLEAWFCFLRNSDMRQRTAASSKSSYDTSHGRSTERGKNWASGEQRPEHWYRKSCQTRHYAQRSANQSSFFRSPKGVFIHRNILRVLCPQ